MHRHPFAFCLIFTHFTSFPLYINKHARFQCLSDTSAFQFSSTLNFSGQLVLSLYTLPQMYKMKYTWFLVMFSFEWGSVWEWYLQRVELLLNAILMLDCRLFESNVPLMYGRHTAAEFWLLLLYLRLLGWTKTKENKKQVYFNT